MFDAKQLLDLIAAGRFADAGGALAAGVDGALGQGKAAATEAASAARQATTDAAGQTADALSNVLGQAQSQFQGTQAGEYIGKAKEIVEQNPVGTLATLGGLAALLLGTPGGRATTGGLVKLGGLAAIGGLAYKALRNYQDGKPLTAGVPGLSQLTAPPAQTPFSAESHTNDTALLLLRTMVATAAADGNVDAAQRAQIIGQLSGAGVAEEAAQFLDNEIRNPASPAELAREAGDSKELALQAYAAARLVARSPQEKSFAQALAGALRLDPALVAHIEASAAHA